MMRQLATIGGGLLLTLAPLVVVAATARWFFPLSTATISTQSGEEIFQQRCTSCHSAEEGRPSPFGPPLWEIGRLAANRRPGYSAEAYLVESVVKPAAFQPGGIEGVMPVTAAAGLTRPQILALVAYLASRQGRPDYGRLLALTDSIPPAQSQPKLRVSLEQALAGQDLFWNKFKCITCHDLDEAPHSNLLAPSLTGVGRHDPEYLREAIQHPSRKFVPGYETTLAVTSDGQTLSGRKLPGPKGVLRLLRSREDRPGLEVLDVPESELEPPADDSEGLTVTSAISAMPDYQRDMSAEELESLVAFLSTLR